MGTQTSLRCVGRYTLVVFWAGYEEGGIPGTGDWEEREWAARAHKHTSLSASHDLSGRLGRQPRLHSSVSGSYPPHSSPPAKYTDPRSTRRCSRAAGSSGKPPSSVVPSS